MRPIESLIHLRDAWLREPHPHRELTATLRVCPACRDALFNDLGSLFTLKTSPNLEDAQVMGFALRDGTPGQCALHALLQEDVACPSK